MRIKYVITGILFLLCFYCNTHDAQASASEAPNDFVNVISPDGNLQARIFVPGSAQLSFEIAYKGRLLVETSPLGITVDGVGLGSGVVLGESTNYEIDETYPWLGVHSTAVNRCNGTKLEVTHSITKKTYTVEVRAFNDGVAFRYVVPGEGERVVSGEATSFTIPEKSTVWYHDFHMHYEGKHAKKDISEVAAGEWVAPPLTYRLSGDLGYASITESAIINYSGMGLQSNGNRSFSVRLGHEQEVSYPYYLRYDDAARLSVPAAIDGPITTPWRVVMAGQDLNTLFNSDIVHNLAPAPDKKYFPNGFNEDWLKPGRAVWGYLTEEPRTLEGMKNLSKLAGELGFEYHIVEGHWRNWTMEERKDLVQYSKEQNVKILLWQHSKVLRDPKELKAFFEILDELGAAGAKIDFFDHEAKEIEDLYRACLEEAAKYKMVLDFHGASKPAGELRTWPNELAREAIRGFEGRAPWANHNVTLPFTRMLAGGADYTPLHFGDRRGETSETHQIASALILQAPMLVYADHPENILKHKAVDVIKQIPAVWDETIVLPASEIGKVAAFVRRKGNKWFVAVMNGEEGKFVEVNLSFLPDGDHTVTMVRDEKPDAAMVSFTRKRLSFGGRRA